ncbi:unnamed protein product [Rangifer tarandus platyrhynchus]|uniref:Uncharacterized protein n=1 Tax=Rangifer tarandus platyrhynchus TaxID=3082113 RepID=A0AC60A554_RANTA
MQAPSEGSPAHQERSPQLIRCSKHRVDERGRVFSTQPLSRHEAQESSNCDAGDGPVAGAAQRCGSGAGSAQTPRGTAPGKTAFTADASCWPTRSPVLPAHRLHT